MQVRVPETGQGVHGGCSPRGLGRGLEGDGDLGCPAAFEGRVVLPLPQSHLYVAQAWEAADPGSRCRLGFALRKSRRGPGAGVRPAACPAAVRMAFIPERGSGLPSEYTPRGSGLTRLC